MKLTIVYDNNAKPGLKFGWGFSCLIEGEQNILFDTGENGKSLLYNFEKLQIMPESVDKVVISHNHWDHTGGLKAFQGINASAEVIGPKAFTEPAEISPGVYTTGAMGRLPKEQSLVVSTGNGNVVITGCAHPGLGNIINRSKELGEIYGVVGGFHGFSRLEKLRRIKLIGPCHCTKYIRQIRAKYPSEFTETRAGSVLEF